MECGVRVQTIDSRQDPYITYMHLKDKHIILTLTLYAPIIAFALYDHRGVAVHDLGDSETVVVRAPLSEIKEMLALAIGRSEENLGSRISA